jgi:flagellar biosynthesis/type III secretory pathway protein FliH
LHLRDHKEAVRKIVARLAGLAPSERATALEQLFILAGLRRLEETVEQEARKMPVYIDILENKVLGREFKKGLQEGRQEGELAILRRLIERRFGSLPSWAEQRLAGASTEQLEELATRVLDAASLEELLGSPSV